MSRLTLKGTIKAIGTTQTFGTSGFQKREFVVDEADAKFPNPVKFTLKKENCSLINSFKKGDSVSVTARVNGREWTNPKTNTPQYFIDLDAYKIEAEGEKEDKKSKSVPEPATPSADALMDMGEEMPF